jgi:hypothetical protein
VTTFAQLSSTVQIAPQVSIGVSFSYSDNQENGASTALPDNTTPHYQLLTLSLSSGYKITKKMSLSFGYDFTMRTSGSAPGGQNQNYTQNEFIVTLSYQF